MPRIAPLEHGEGLTNRKGAGWILERDDAALTGCELSDIGVLLELQVGTEVGSGGRKSELDVRASGIRDLKIHVTLNFH